MYVRDGETGKVSEVQTTEDSTWQIVRGVHGKIV